MRPKNARGRHSQELPRDVEEDVTKVPEGIDIRLACPEEAQQLSAMARAMVTDMASYGGHAVSTEQSSWDELADMFKGQIEDADYRCLVAESSEAKLVGFAGGEARLLGGAFEQKRTLHISAVYVLPEFRSRGIAESLLKALLAWGREVECAEAELNILRDNPVYPLYEKLGFMEFQRQLLRRL